MLLARRDVAFARGRFALVGGVVALLTLLVALLSGLTGGLGSQSTSALCAAGKAGAARVLLAGDAVGLSSVTDAQLRNATAQDADALPLTIGMVRLEAGPGNGAASASPRASSGPVQAAVFAAPRPSAWVPSVPDSGVALPSAVADELGVGAGDTVTLNGIAQKVSSVSAPGLSYAHAPVVGLPESATREVLHTRTPNAILSADPALTVEGLTSATVKEAFNAVPGYRSEHGSLLLIQVILYVIAGLVVAAFLTIWTLQRTRDLALLRALGASEGFLVRDGLAQSAIVVLGGVLVGALSGWGLAGLASRAVPFEVSMATIGGPGLLVLAVGLLGSLAAVTRVRSINPLTALGGN
ncbi:ABC transporter permease [Falsarthrobacter nasiphocae]|uniref:ABC transport system permease protein n=1 Tax=Falsarthrobacter nasiphocae TaxID=189863 RepID=A0AAE3YG16_9MICC|nr:ABC transporter permease [Falsarthrobacter nasiphocae]MDR6892097.1 putative ABC transport system permease protein [Falsarthrobacter nasiphocae]